MNRWHLTDELREKFKPVLKEYFDKVENITDEEINEMTNEELGIDFSDKGINPSQLIDLLGEFGYEEFYQDEGGWEKYCWINLRRKDDKTFPSTCEKLVVYFCGRTFELKLFLDGFDF